MSLTLIALAAATASHSVTINHHGKPMQAIYTARTDINTRTVGAKTPNRMDMQRCNWTATIVVDRKLDQGPALSRTISDDMRFSGSEIGPCAFGQKMEQRLSARYRDDIQAQLMTAAAQDGAALLAELESVRNLASN